jgi:hypothetical protein
VDAKLAVFIAGCVGAAVLQSLGERNRSTVTKSQRICVTDVLNAVGRVILAGYLSAFIFDVSQPLHAFLIGLGLDSVLISSRRTALQFCSRRQSDTIADMKGFDGH